MAAQHLTVLSSPSFPQVFEDLIDFEIRRVDRILAQAQLSTCDFGDEDCNCHEKAVVHDLATEREYCVRHFEAVNRG